MRRVRYGNGREVGDRPGLVAKQRRRATGKNKLAKCYV
jgi:hypothetical protein